MGNSTPIVVWILGGMLSAACAPKEKNQTPPPPPSVAASVTNPIAVKTPVVSDRGTPIEKMSPVDPVPLWRSSLDEYALIRLNVSGFSERTTSEKRLAMHWVNAARAGHVIALDQKHRLGWPLRATLDRLLKQPNASTRSWSSDLEDYAGQVWVSNGPYDRTTGQKLVPGFSREQWSKALKSLPKLTHQWPASTAVELERLLFDSTFDNRLIVRHPRGREDPLFSSGSNLYVGVRLSDLKGFSAVYPSNSRLVKRDGQLVEEVYRAGRRGGADGRPAPAGRYASQLRSVCQEIRAGMAFVTSEQRRMYSHLLEYLESGDRAAFDRFNMAWLADKSALQLMAGFIETDLDPRGVKGEWEATVLVRDEQVSRWIQGVVSSAQYFENRSPWAAEYKKTWDSVSAPEAMEVLAGSGGTAPVLPTMINLPNSPSIREKHGTRTIYLTNVIRSIDGAVRERGVDEFMLPQHRAAAHQYGGIIDGLELVLHEVLGHGSGKVTETFAHKQPAVALREYSTAVEEARAMLVALHHFWDPRLRTIAPECPDACAASALEQFVAHDLMQLRWVRRERLEDAHRRAVRLIVQYARSKDAVAQIEREGKWYQHITDMGLMRSAVRSLLAELMRIKAVGDYAAAKDLFEKYALRVDVPVRDQVGTRAARIGLPGRFAFILPSLRLQGDQVQLENTETFREQQLAIPVPLNLIRP